MGFEVMQTASLLLAASLGLLSAAQTPSPALLVLNKQEGTLAIVDPTTLKTVVKIPTGENPHEVAVSADGRFAFTSNYGRNNTGHTVSVVDLIAQKERRVDLGTLDGIHGIASFDGKVIFAAEGPRVIGRYDPATGKV